MAKFKYRYPEVEAMQYPGPQTHGEGIKELLAFDQWLAEKTKETQINPKYSGIYLIFPTSEGTARLIPGDWVILKESGVVLGAKKGVFERVFEKVEE